MADISRTVLIIENDPATRLMYERALQKSYHVIAASDEVDIGAVLTGRALHAVALEPGPVGGRGWALLAELKRRPETHSIPVILCTAQDERRRGLEMGVAVYLVKPILPADLLATIRRIVGENISEGGLT